MGLPITPSEYGIVEEDITSFTFRNEGKFKIPKAKRELAFSMAIDITIETIDWNLYENGKSSPPIQFYGYAILVFQDSIWEAIPIRFPIQRIYFAEQWEAYRQWDSLAKYWEHWQLHRWNEIKILELQGAIGIEDIVDFSPQFGDTQWKELPLREIYFKFPINTQFSVEYIQWQPVEYEDPFGNTRNGKSNQIDSEKDDGLPKNGIQPKKNDKSDPFAGAPASKGIPTLDNGFFLSNDGLDLGQGTEDRPASATEEGWYLSYFLIALPDPTGDYFEGLINVPSTRTSALDVSIRPNTVRTVPISGCSDYVIHTIDIKISGTTYNVPFDVLTNFTVNGEVLYGLLPEDTIARKPKCLI